MCNYGCIASRPFPERKMSFDRIHAMTTTCKANYADMNRFDLMIQDGSLENEFVLRPSTTDGD